ncbi:uncharacterized protein LOC129600053 [Paramacrobiotus metropolitanus]|uniref:uncharacterized protein LOC129600053 n=1 Tax=Paramacrobiotus metropolitanus TaxID=2943436 RepID=UPI002445B498|nr:uncharacterized protein LOC129600053 [Paramacrobiotus metropolitanus]
MAGIKIFLWAVVSFAIVGLVASYPAASVDVEEENEVALYGHHGHGHHNHSTLANNEKEDGAGDTKVTCDLLGGLGIGPISLGENTLCAMHCGQIKCKSGGSCKDGVCVCRKDQASCWIYLCKGCKW